MRRREAPRREQAVLCCAGRIPEAPVPEEKVPGGVERRRRGVGADVARVVVVVVSQRRGRRVAGRLRGERRLAGGELVRAVVDLEGAHAVRERVDAQRHLPLAHLACCVVPRGAERGDSYGGILRSCVQEHLQSELAEARLRREMGNSRADMLPSCLPSLLVCLLPPPSLPCLSRLHELSPPPREKRKKREIR